jgi:hypothetical protein
VELVYSSAFADYARTASYLLLSPGQTSGTSSYALTASYLIGGSGNSATASYLQNANITIDGNGNIISNGLINMASGNFVVDDNGNVIIAGELTNDNISLNQNGSANFSSGQVTIDVNGNIIATSITSSLNGTASWALRAGSVSNVLIDYGVYTASTQSISSSQIDYVAVTPTFESTATTTVETYGTVNVPFTSSAGPTNGYLELFVVDRKYGYSQSLDASPVYLGIGGGSAISGTLKYPFTLRGDAELNGQYEVYVTASNGVYIEVSRMVRFKITSESDQLSVTTSAEPMKFNTYPTTRILFYSSSLHPGVAYQGSASQVTFSGSTDVSELFIPANGVNIMNYTWTLTGLKKLTVDNNLSLTYLGGLPTGCISASAANCGLIELPLFASSSVSYLNVPNNAIVSSLSLPQSMSYLNVANNPYVFLPSSLPAGMTTLIADGTGMTQTPISVPNTLVSMSFAQCSQLSSWSTYSLPASLKYLDVNSSPLTNFPSIISPGLLFVNVSNCLLSSATISNLASALVVNGLSNGYFAFLNNPSSGSAFSIITNINTLRGSGWTIVS